MLPKTNPTQTQTWQELQKHHQWVSKAHMRDWFLSNPMRFRQFSFECSNILFDFSKNRITTETLELFEKLFDECRLKESIEALFTGAQINATEKRSVLHTALRHFGDDQIMVNGENIMPAIKASREKMKDFSSRVINGSWKGFTGRPVENIVNIGIGGSDLGPAMVYEALRPFHVNHIKCHFVSNVDGAHIYETLKSLNPETTLFVIASKTFTTLETMTNARTARKWFIENGGHEDFVNRHFVAVSTNKTAVADFGIDPQNMFEFWDWVGGRYSVWSAIGLSLCCGIGYQNYEEFLRGAESMDHQFRNAPFSENPPMLMAAIGIWYTNFFNAATEAIIPYSQNLSRFAAYLQQGNMESNGKCRDRNGSAVNYSTGPIIWGEPGTNGQHAFFQLIHQGTQLIPCDFIGFANSSYPDKDHHHKLMANFLGQTEALMKGKTRAELEAENQDMELIPYKEFEGNRPTTTILAPQLTPGILGNLMACYEHKIFTQGIIWNIYSFDQWGVELGKNLAKDILPHLRENKKAAGHDSSTSGLIDYYCNHQL